MSKLYVVGIGPGNLENMTQMCIQSLNESDVIVGYSRYIKLISPYFENKQFYQTEMTKETERCQMAIDLTKEHETVSIISSGDAGVYGMASLIFELAAGMSDLEVIVVPGVTAALSGAALLGAPLGHDFAVISLSDLLTPWELIEKRLEKAAEADFVISLYNPGSKKRADYLSRACDILLKHKKKDTVCGIARSIGRDGQSYSLTTLEKLRDMQADMQETVFIGSSASLNIDGRMVTPRGYENA